MQDTIDLETMGIELERVLHLLGLVFEELEDAPLQNVSSDKDEMWKAIYFSQRAPIMESLIYSVHSLIEAQKNTIENWVEKKHNVSV